MRCSSVWMTVWALTVAVAATAQAGCKSCAKDPPPAATGSGGAEASKAEAAAVAPAAAPTAVAAADPATPEVFPGPRSESLDGWRITSGFASAKDEALSEPRAMEDCKVYLTVLDQGGRPIGQLDKLERAEMHLFLVAKDLRHAVYGHGSGPVREGADARAVTVRAPEGGDHAMIAVFRPSAGVPRTVSAPVTIKGALPQVMGPGVASLGMRAASEAETLLLTSDPSTPTAGQVVKLRAQDIVVAPGKPDQPKGEVRLPYIVLLNDQMGWGDVVEWTPEGYAQWTPPRPGDYLVLAPPTRGTKALAFRLSVEAARKP